MRFRDRGGTNEQASQVLERLREEASTEAEEDRVLDMLDVVVGWCAPHAKVW